MTDGRPRRVTGIRTGRRMSSAPGATATSARSACAMRRRPPVRGMRQRRSEDGAPADGRSPAAAWVRRRRCVTYGLIAINVVAFVAQKASPQVRGGAVDVVARRRPRRAVPLVHVGVSAQRDHPHPVQHVRVVRGGSAAGDLAGPTAFHCAVSVERDGRFGADLSVLAAGCADPWCVGSGIRVVRSHLRGG